MSAERVCTAEVSMNGIAAASKEINCRAQGYRA